MELLSNVRLGVACGLIQSVGYEKILSAMLQVQPATLAQFAGQALHAGQELDEEQGGGFAGGVCQSFAGGVCGVKGMEASMTVKGAQVDF